MPKVSVPDLERVLTVPPGANLREALLDGDVTLYPFHAALLNCRGRGLCGTCRVKVISGEENLTPRTSAESKKLAGRPDLRLACQCAVRGDCAVLTLP